MLEVPGPAASSLLRYPRLEASPAAPAEDSKAALMACKAGTGSRRISSIDLYQIIDDIGPPSGTNEAQWLAKANQESSYRVDCVNASGHTGLWQISPAWMQKLGTNETAMRNDPRLQFRIAKRVYSEGRGWAEWNASGGQPSGAGQASVTSPGDLIAGAAGLAESLDPVAGLVAPISQIAGTLTGFFEWLTDPNTWKRIALVAAGAGILFVGGAAVARGTEIGQTVESVAKNVTPAGRVAGTAQRASTVAKAQRSMKAGAAKTRPKG